MVVPIPISTIFNGYYYLYIEVCTPTQANGKFISDQRHIQQKEIQQVVLVVQRLGGKA